MNTIASLPSRLLELHDVDTYYGAVQVHFGVTLYVQPGEIVCLLGGNASGKSTTMKVILGLVKPRAGLVRFKGQNIIGLSTPQIIRLGIGSVPEARRIFANMTVRENLLMGAYHRTDKITVAQDYERILGLFPRLQERIKQRGGVLSGGEQQMLAIGRALMGRPQLICMDEPTMGLSPAFVDNVLELIQTINGQGTAIFMVEQNANLALQIAHRGYVLQNGHIVLEGAAKQLLDSREVQQAYLGGQASPL
ncbi:MAG: ATP-binding cassette domain-containing protein [Anaerolineaceae bacterium]|nr:ATP-binding cassette domain-containing protein [Anaerolineaceae bacterium]